MLAPVGFFLPTLSKAESRLEFFILKDGKDQQSGDDAALGPPATWPSDRLHGRASISSSPFAALPARVPEGSDWGLRFSFYYNLDRDEITITPCTDVRVPAGSTVQFSASGKGITDTSVDVECFRSGVCEISLWDHFRKWTLHLTCRHSPARAGQGRCGIAQ